MADDTNDHQTPSFPTPGRGFGPAGSMTMEEAAETIVRDHHLTLPIQVRGGSSTNDKGPSFKESTEAARDRFAARDSKEEKRNLLIREQTERLNEARDGGWAMFQQLRSEPGREFRSQDLTTYYVEPEGKFLIARDVRGNFEAFELSVIGNMLERQAAQHRQQGGELPRTPVKLKGPTQADTNNLIANLKSRIAWASQGKVYESIHKIEKEMRDKFVAAASIPETKTPAIGLDPDKGKVDMVMAIATYGREEGKNMVRELRGTGGEIEQHKLVYKVEGETFSRTHPDKTTFDYKADEIEQAVDVRQKELGAIDVWESKSPPAVSEETLDALATLDGIEQTPAVELATTEETLAALDLLNDHDQQPREQAVEQQPEAMTEEQWQQKAQEYKADLMVDDHQGFKLDASRSKDGPELHDEPETPGETQEREEIATRQAIIDGLRERPEGAVAEHDISTYVLKGDQLLERIQGAEWEDWAIWDANDPSRQIDSSQKQEAEVLHAFGHPDAQWRSLPERDDPPMIEEADVAFDQEQSQAVERDQHADTDALKAEIAALQEKLAAYEKPQEQAQPAVSSTPVEKADQQRAPAKEMQLGAEQGKREVTDKEVIDQVEGRTKGGEWFNVLSDRYAKREAAGEKVEDKPFVARARESEAVAVSKPLDPQHTPTL
ncbi:hypothetical protein ACC684_28355 [Rhizobium ruizarguesonis]